jgi:hypothetical protein
MTRQKKYEKEIEKAQALFQRNIEVIAEEIRNEIVIPICIRHNINFSSGMGIFNFWNPKKEHWNFDIKYGAKDIRKALEILNIDIDRSNQLGHYISDYIYITKEK